MSSEILEEPSRTAVAGEFDICVVGGGCTGVFAAVAAARLGSRVAIIENGAFFGGVATASLVNVWHSIHDLSGTRQIIAGLTTEVMEHLLSRGAMSRHGDIGRESHVFNSAELALELDELVRGAGVRPFLHTRFVCPFLEGDRLAAVAVEDVSGRRAIRASYFVDATGNGALAARMGLPFRKHPSPQPPTTCALIQGLDEIRTRDPGFSLSSAVFDPGSEDSLPEGFLWLAEVPGLKDISMVAGTRVFSADCSDADQLTKAEMEGRRQVKVICDILRRDLPEGRGPLVALPARIGVRETRHIRCHHTLTEEEVLRGRRFRDAIANGTYRVDIHLPDRAGIIFKYLDGTEEFISRSKRETGRWLEDGAESADFYQIPFASLVPRCGVNVIGAGRLIDADPGAFGAIRVMVNCNQTGEAAGTACHLGVEENAPIGEIDSAELRSVLREQGSIVI